MKIITIGGAAQDIFMTHEDPKMLRLYSKKIHKEFLILQEGSKIEIEKLSYYTGGGATNSSVSFSRLGFNVKAICKLGTDCQANLVTEKLKNEGVDISWITTTNTYNTATSIIIPSITGDRTVLAYRGANTTLTKQDIDENMLSQCDQIYITSLSGQSAKLLPYITNIAKTHNIPVATNPGSSQLAQGAIELRESLKNIDTFVLNSEEANIFMHTLTQVDKNLKKNLIKDQNKSNINDAPTLLKSPIMYQDICFSLHSYFNEILKRGPKIAVVTNGAEGVYIATNKHIYFHPSIKTKIVSTLGAGDSFSSCFVAQLTKGNSLETAMTAGIINSSSVISYLDAKTGLLSEKELQKRLKALSTSNIETFPLEK